MRLTMFSDFAVRLLVYAARNQPKMLTIEQAAGNLGISLGHAKKLVMVLAREGYLQTTAGRRGGFVLARAPDEIRLGALLRRTEPDFCLIECLGSDSRCPLIGCCTFSGALGEALAAFLDVLDNKTLADVIRLGGGTG